MQNPQDGHASYSLCVTPAWTPALNLYCISSHTSGLVLEVDFCEHKRTAFVQINNFAGMENGKILVQFP